MTKVVIAKVENSSEREGGEGGGRGGGGGAGCGLLLSDDTARQLTYPSER